MGGVLPQKVAIRDGKRTGGIGVSRDNSRRFMNAFIGVEQELRSLIGAKTHKPFYTLVNAAAKMNDMVHDISDELKEYADLRNVIVHERRGEEPIAEPHVEIVERLEHILDLLQKPPTVGDEFLGEVVTCTLEDKVGIAAKRMYKHSFSKIPVYDGDTFKGLLTAEGITHWLGDRLDDESCTLADETVASVLAYVENGHTYRFVGKDWAVFRVIDFFEEASHKGQRLQAVLITESGMESDPLLGIITVFDLPRIYNLIGS